MISRKAARAIAEVYERTFRKSHSQRRKSSYHGIHRYYTIDTSPLYDFLFDNNYSAYFCNAAKKTYETTRTRRFKEFLMTLHTGESLVTATPDWSWENRQKLGQKYLHDLAEDILDYWDPKNTRPSNKSALDAVANLRKQLELEGYRFESGRLLESETGVLDVKEETGVIHTLYEELLLANQKTTFHHLDLTESHYVENRWDDSISNSRKFLESVLAEVAVAHSSCCRGEDLPGSIRSKPVRVRDYLEQEGLLESKEKDAVASVYGLLSETGGHPYMAQSEQARLLRHLALIFSQFVMLRLKGKLGSST